jgi:hypothetical protein
MVIEILQSSTNFSAHVAPYQLPSLGPTCHTHSLSSLFPPFLSLRPSLSPIPHPHPGPPCLSRIEQPRSSSPTAAPGAEVTDPGPRTPRRNSSEAAATPTHGSIRRIHGRRRRATASTRATVKLQGSPSLARIQRRQARAHIPPTTACRPLPCSELHKRPRFGGGGCSPRRAGAGWSQAAGSDVTSVALARTPTPAARASDDGGAASSSGSQICIGAMEVPAVPPQFVLELLHLAPSSFLSPSRCRVAVSLPASPLSSGVPGSAGGTGWRAGAGPTLRRRVVVFPGPPGMGDPARERDVPYGLSSPGAGRNDKSIWDRVVASRWRTLVWIA